MECRRPYDYALWTVHFADATEMDIGEFTNSHARKVILSPYRQLNNKNGKDMADEQTALKTENLKEITLPDFVEMVKQMRHNQRRCERNPNTGKNKYPDRMGTES